MSLEGGGPADEPISLRRGESIVLEVDVTDHPPVEQMLVVLAADRRECLPGNLDEQAFLTCLNEGCPPASPDADVLVCLDSVPICAPGEVQVLATTFVVE